MRVYSPALASAAAEYVSVHGAKAGSGITSQGVKGARRRLEKSRHVGTSHRRNRAHRRTVALLFGPAPQDGEILERTAVNGMRAAPGGIVPHRRSQGGLGGRRCRRARSGSDIDRPESRRASPRLPGSRVQRRGCADLSSSERANPDRADTDRVAKPGRSVAAGHVCRRGNATGTEAGPDGAGSAVIDSGSGKSSCSIRAKDGSSRARSNLGAAAMAASRSGRR